MGDIFDPLDKYFPGNPESRTIDKRNPNYKINYIINFFMDMCDAPYSVYVETLWPALLEAFWTYYKPDLVQIFTGYVRPLGMYKNIRGGSHGGGKRKKRPTRTWNKYWNKFSSFDPNNEIAKWLPIDPTDRYRTPGRGVITLWQLFDVQQRVAYWCMIYEITEEFFYNWSNGVAASYYCQQQYRPWLFCQSGDDGNIALLPETPIVIETVVKARHVSFVGGNGGGVEGRGSSAIFQARQVDGRGLPPNTPGQFLRIRHSSGLVIDSPSFPDEGSTVVASGSVLEEGIWTFWTVGPYNYLLDRLEITVIGFQNYIEL